MALKGNLKDFSLPDVFQLVAFSRKTGVLRITREDGATGTVWFRDGDVFFASSNWHTRLLGERLVQAGRVTPNALDAALKIREAEGSKGRRLGQILVDQGAITESVLETFVSEQIQDTIFDLMRWDEGDFDFESMPEVADEDIGLAVSIENVVMEGARRLEEWNRIRKKVPSTDVVFVMSTAPGEGTYEISLKPSEWRLLLLIDGTRSVAELAVETGHTDFEVARIVYGLFSAGLLEFATDEQIERNREDRSRRELEIADARQHEGAPEEAETVEAQPPVEHGSSDGSASEVAPEAAVTEESEPAMEAQVEAEPESEPEVEPEGAPEVEPEPEVETPVEPDAEPPTETEVPEFLGAPSQEPIAGSGSLETYMDAVLQPSTPEPSQPAVATDEVDAAGKPGAPAEPPRDFAQDLLALGLGELPRELGAPEEPESRPIYVPRPAPRSDGLIDIFEIATEIEIEGEVPEPGIPVTEFTPELLHPVETTGEQATGEDSEPSFEAAPAADMGGIAESVSTLTPEVPVVETLSHGDTDEVTEAQEFWEEPSERPGIDDSVDDASLTGVLTRLTPEPEPEPEVDKVAELIADLDADGSADDFSGAADEGYPELESLEPGEAEEAERVQAEVPQTLEPIIHVDSAQAPDVAVDSEQDVAVTATDEFEMEFDELEPVAEPMSALVERESTPAPADTPSSAEAVSASETDDARPTAAAGLEPEMGTESVSAEADVAEEGVEAPDLTALLAALEAPEESPEDARSAAGADDDVLDLDEAESGESEAAAAFASELADEPEAELAEEPEADVAAAGYEAGQDATAAETPGLVEDELEMEYEATTVLEVVVEEEIEISSPGAEPSLGQDDEQLASSPVDDLLGDELDRSKPSAGVISTDAYMEDITISDLGLATGLGDELSALTGADRRMPARPQAVVKSAEAAERGVIRRDTRVDRETLLKIIDGLKEL